MNNKVKELLNKKYGIIFMVFSVLLMIILVLNIQWRDHLTFMGNLSNGYILEVEEFFSEECEGYGNYKKCTADSLFIYFKHIVIIPMATFLFGLFGYLNNSKNN